MAASVPLCTACQIGFGQDSRAGRLSKGEESVWSCWWLAGAVTGGFCHVKGSTQLAGRPCGFLITPLPGKISMRREQSRGVEQGRRAELSIDARYGSSNWSICSALGLPSSFRPLKPPTTSSHVPTPPGGACHDVARDEAQVWRRLELKMTTC